MSELKKRGRATQRPLAAETGVTARFTRGTKRYLSGTWDYLFVRRYRSRQLVGASFATGLVVLARPSWQGFAVGAVLAVLGALVRLWAAGHIHKNASLATAGPYAYVRHPQYFGNSLVALACSFATGRLWAVVVWAAFFWLFYVPAIRREDDKLKRRFGDNWQRWSERTPALIPIPWSGTRSLPASQGWSVRQTVRNGEPLWLVLILAAVLSIYLRLPQ